MKYTRLAIPDVILIEPQVFGDDRGYFFESFRQSEFNDFVGKEVDFVQHNQSFSQKGVLRGLHFQNPPFAQGKLVRVIKGSVYDVAVDIRKGSPTYGQHVIQKLSEENKLQMYVPPGFAHGFVTLEDDTVFCYMCTGMYDKESEGSVLFNDKDLGIDWGISNPILSEKDEVAPSFKELESQFNFGEF